jgi:hypothetical protein
MKNFILISTLVISSTTFANTSGTLLLQGVVAQKLSIAVSPVTASSALDLTASPTDLKVASVNEKSNSKTGYKVTISSTNSGNLKRTDGADVFSYTMKYGGAAVALSTGGTTFSQMSAASVNVNKDLAISYTGIAAESMVEGTYTDTLTLNIAAN